MSVRLLSPLLPLFLSACAIGHVPHGTAALAESEAVFVMGVSNKDSVIQVYPGKLQDGVFRLAGIDRAVAFVGKPVDGYITGKARAGDSLAVLHVTVNEPNGKGIRQYGASACGAAKTMIFTIKGGKTNYVGDLDVRVIGNRIHLGNGLNPEAAKNFIQSRYPGLASGFEVGTYSLAPTNESCTKVQWR